MTVKAPDLLSGAFKRSHIMIFKTIRIARPGRPKMPITSAFIRLTEIVIPKTPPIRLKNKRIMNPKRVLRKILKINLIGFLIILKRITITRININKEKINATVFAPVPGRADTCMNFEKMI